MGKTKEEQQQELNEKRYLRQKQIAQLRASNEMLEEAKATIIKHYGKDSHQAKELLQDVDIAKSQNLERAATYLQASREEVEQTNYNKVDPETVENYKRRLELRGVTDEQIHQKDISKEIGATTTTEQSKPKSKMETLMDKLNLLNKNKAKGGTTVDASTQESKPMSDEEFKKLVESRRDDVTDYVIEMPNTSTLKVEEPVKEEQQQDVRIPTTAKVTSIEEVNPTLSYNKEKLNDCVGFDPRDIPSYVQYDVIPLPSKGECYPNKQKAIPVAYLTAADENLITSPNLYNNGSLIDIILERKILDKRIHVRDLCNGDRDAILVWLRATAYGVEYPIIATHNGKQFQTSVDLSKLKYKEFNLKGDENGYFDYETINGDKLKCKVLSHGEEEMLLEQAKRMYNETNAHDITTYCNKILDNLAMISNADNTEELETVYNTVKGVKEWAEGIAIIENVKTEALYNTAVTNRMIANTVSINGNSDPEYIKSYIENMRANEAKKYREFISDNIPGIDFKINVNIPESEGGGSFETFLGLSETLFINV